MSLFPDSFISFHPLCILLNSMASRAMSRSLITSARSALHSTGNSSRAAGGRSASSTTRTAFAEGRNPFGNSASFRRRCAESSIPLHNAVAAAKLISHLSVSSRNCSALSLGLQGYINAAFNALRDV
eukprot:Gb_19252 [translate_table: standard]